MLRSSFLLVVVVFSLYGCGNERQPTPPASAPIAVKKEVVQPAPAVIADTPPPDIKKERAALDRYMSRMATPSQHLMAAAGKTSVVRGKEGTLITIVPTDLVTEEGQPVTSTIDVELKELTNTTAFLEENTPTVSDGKLLASGGSYYVHLTSDGQPLKLKLGKSLKVNLPKQTNEDMTLFYGQRDSAGKMNWKPAAQKFVSIQPGTMSMQRPAERTTDSTRDVATPGGISLNGLKSGTISRGELVRRLFDDDTSALIDKNPPRKRDVTQKKLDSLTSKIYDQVAVEKLGWINCDRFLNETNLTNVVYNFDKHDSIVVANAYLVFASINSVMRDDYGYAPTGRFPHVPVGAKATLIAIAVKNGKTYTSRSEVIVAKNANITVNMKKSSDKEIHELFAFGK